MSDLERAMVERAPLIGHRILSRIPRLEEAANIVRYQKKNFDGSGLPSDATAGDQIPLGSRLLRILSDVFELESRGIPTKTAFFELRRRSGAYDPELFEKAAEALGGAPVLAEVQSITLREMAGGEVLVSALETLDGMLIAPAGTTVSPTMLETIRNLGELIAIAEPIRVKRQPAGKSA